MLFSRLTHRRCRICGKIQPRRYVERRCCRDCNFLTSEFRVMCEWFGGVCLRCGRQRPLCADHVIPHHFGGSDHLRNMQPLCRSCNSQKHTQYADYRDPQMLRDLLQHLGYTD